MSNIQIFREVNRVDDYLVRAASRIMADPLGFRERFFNGVKVIKQMKNKEREKARKEKAK